MQQMLIYVTITEILIIWVLRNLGILLLPPYCVFMLLPLTVAAFYVGGLLVVLCRTVSLH